MDFTKLSDEQRRQFDEEGYIIVKGALQADQIATLIDAADRVIATDRTENRQRTPNGLYDGFRNCLALDNAFLALLTHSKTVPLVVQLLGANIHMVTSHLIYKHPDSPETPSSVREPGWHRDVAGTTEDLGYANTPRMEMKVAYYLTDLSKPNYGATLFSPGSNHLKERIDVPDGKVDPLNAIEPLLEAGDAVLFENRTWHAATANHSGHTRKCVMFGYGYRWLKPFDYLRQPEEITEKLDPIGRQLIGEHEEAGGAFRFGGSSKPIGDWCDKHGVAKTSA